MFNPQSRTNEDSGLNNFVSDLRAASWIAAGLDFFERCTELRREFDLCKKLSYKYRRAITTPVAKIRLFTNDKGSLAIPGSVPLVHYVHAMNGPSRLMQILGT
jgi:hypothetical protein